MDWIGLHDISQKFLSAVGGRVVPISLLGRNQSPFLLLVHHRHSFHPLDPFRPLTRLFLPEGFPAHAHAGFDTVTYTLSGGLRHRDSSALSQDYGDGDVQWMRAGSGIIHEEMWNGERVELFQLWVDLPSKHRNDPPFTSLLRNTSLPLLHLPQHNLSVKVISGTCSASKDDNDTMTVVGPGVDVAASPVGLYHLFQHPLDSPSSDTDTNRADVTCNLRVTGASFALFYLRSGELLLRKTEGSSSEEERVTAGNYLLFESTAAGRKEGKGEEEGEESVDVLLRGVSGGGKGRGFDGLLLTGRRLAQPVLSAGSFIDSDEGALMTSVEAFRRVEAMQGFWDHRITDEDWLSHCSRAKVDDVIRRFKNLKNR